MRIARPVAYKIRGSGDFERVKDLQKSDKNKRRMNFKRRKPENAFGWRMRGFTCFEVR